jgi:hypothetical protein
MARRASSSAHPVWILAGVALLLAALGGGYLFFGKGGSNGGKFRGLTSLPIADYLDNSNSLRGNVYKLEGTIFKSLEFSPTAGRLFSVEVGQDLVPVLVPPQFNHVNIERGQRFSFKIKVEEKGVLTAEDVEKI